MSLVQSSARRGLAGGKAARRTRNSSFSSSLLSFVSPRQLFSKRHSFSSPSHSPSHSSRAGSPTISGFHSGSSRGPDAKGAQIPSGDRRKTFSFGSGGSGGSSGGGTGACATPVPGYMATKAAQRFSSLVSLHCSGGSFSFPIKEQLFFILTNPLRQIAAGSLADSSGGSTAGVLPPCRRKKKVSLRRSKNSLKSSTSPSPSASSSSSSSSTSTPAAADSPSAAVSNFLQCTRRRKHSSLRISVSKGMGLQGSIVRTASCWPAIFAALRGSLFRIRVKCLSDVTFLIANSPANSDSLLQHDSWVVWFLELLVDVRDETALAMDSATSKAEKLTFRLVINCLVNLLYHGEREWKVPAFHALLADFIDGTAEFAGYHAQSQRLVCLVLTTLCQKIANRACDMPVDPMALPFLNLRSLSSTVRAYVFKTFHWQHLEVYSSVPVLPQNFSLLRCLNPIDPNLCFEEQQPILQRAFKNFNYLPSSLDSARGGGSRSPQSPMKEVPKLHDSRNFGVHWTKRPATPPSALPSSGSSVKAGQEEHQAQDPGWQAREDNKGAPPSFKNNYNLIPADLGLVEQVSVMLEAVGLGADSFQPELNPSMKPEERSFLQAIALEAQYFGIAAVVLRNLKPGMVQCDLSGFLEKFTKSMSSLLVAGSRQLVQASLLVDIERMRESLKKVQDKFDRLKARKEMDRIKREAAAVEQDDWEAGRRHLQELEKEALKEQQQEQRHKGAQKVHKAAARGASSAKFSEEEGDGFIDVGSLNPKHLEKSLLNEKLGSLETARKVFSDERRAKEARKGSSQSTSREDSMLETVAKVLSPRKTSYQSDLTSSEASSAKPGHRKHNSLSSKNSLKNNSLSYEPSTSSQRGSASESFVEL